MNQLITLSKRFLLIKIIQRKNSFLTYIALQLKSKIHLLVKITPYLQIHDTLIKKMFQNELNQLIQSKHQIIIKLLYYNHEVIQGNKYTYFVFPYESNTLKTIFQTDNKQKTQIQLVTLAYHILIALEELHKINKIHGRIKPSTIHIDKSKNIKFNLIETHAFDQPKERIKNNKLNKFSRYASIGQILGLKLSAKDDLESLVYVLINMSSHDSILCSENIKKVKSTDNNLLELKKNKIPHTISKYFNELLVDFYFYVMSLNRIQHPKYSYWIKKFQRFLQQHKKQQVLTQILQNQLIQADIFEEDHTLNAKMQKMCLQSCHIKFIS